jgi:CRISPR-associated protein (TIGR02584 family)
MTTTLIAVTGLSPAIVTETLWALAREKPKVLPARVVFITTRTGAEKIREQLHTPLAALDGQTAWQALRATLKAREDELIAEEPRIISRANRKTGTLDTLTDIQTPEENDIAASFILEEVRRVTMNPDTNLIASIAGGRKTMGALLHAAVTLLGRETDRLTHVLVSPPYETMPGFYFPEQPGPPLKDREGRLHPAAKAVVQLADLPFVPLRNRFEETRDLPGSFGGLVRRFSRTMREDAARPRLIEINYRQKRLLVDSQPIKMRVKALAVLHCLLWMQDNGITPTDQTQIAEGMIIWLKKTTDIPLVLKPAAKDITTDTIRHELSELRTALKKAGASWQIPTRSLSLPPFNLRIV